jgi:hypothetical protein
MRLLHARLHREPRWPPRIATAHRPRRPAGRQPVPLHRLRADPARGRGRGGKPVPDWLAGRPLRRGQSPLTSRRCPDTPTRWPTSTRAPRRHADRRGHRCRALGHQGLARSRPGGLHHPCRRDAPDRDRAEICASARRRRWTELRAPSCRAAPELRRDDPPLRLPQVRAAATVGGNIANGSPIGDTPPPLIALDATLHLRRGDMPRDLPLEEFFLDYGKQDRTRASSSRRSPSRASPTGCGSTSCRNASTRTSRPSAARSTSRWRTAPSPRAHRLRRHGGHAETRRAMSKRRSSASPGAARTSRRRWGRVSEDFTPLSDMRASMGYRLATAPTC